MATLAFIFPGQGSQQVGMGSELRSERPQVWQRYFALAEDASGLPVGTLALEGPMARLTETDAAQPALFALSLALAEVAGELGVTPELVAGHSLGEYTAAVATGALGVKDGMRLVSRRGRLMAEIQSSTPGTMAAIIGLEPDVVERLCEEAGEVGLANLNSPEQIVVSGEQGAVERLVGLAEKAGARQAIRLPVGAAFHSAMMKPVQRALAEEMERLSFSDPSVPIASNATGTLIRSADQVRRALVDQIAQPVLWTSCVETLIGAGCHTFLELGPGRVLSRLVRRIDRSTESTAADSVAKLSGFADRQTTNQA